jgi:NADPH:quinone reductase
VKEQDKLTAALKALEGVIDDPMFTTRIGKTFSYDQIDLAMAYESLNGSKAVLVA